MVAEYKRDLSHSYMLIRNEGELRTDAYDLRTILTNRIDGLLPIDAEVVNGEIMLRYDISECVPFASFCEGGRIDPSVLCQLFLGILHTLEEFDDYLLDAGHLLLDPEQVFVRWESGTVYMAYVPFLERDVQKALLGLTESILMQISHEQQDSIVLACRILHELQGRNLQLASLRRLLEEGGAAEGLPFTASAAGAGSGAAPVGSGQGQGSLPQGTGGADPGYGGSATLAAEGAGLGYGSSPPGRGGSARAYGTYGAMAGGGGAGQEAGLHLDAGGGGRGYGSAPYAAGNGKEPYGSFRPFRQDAGEKKGWGRDKTKKEKRKKEKTDDKRTDSLGRGGKGAEEKDVKAEKSKVLKHLPERATVKLALISAIPAALLFAALHVQEVFVLSTAEAAGISILTAALILVILELAARIKGLKAKRQSAPGEPGLPGPGLPQAADSWDAYAGNARAQEEAAQADPGSAAQGRFPGGPRDGARSADFGGRDGGAACGSSGGSGSGDPGGSAGAFVPLYRQARVAPPSYETAGETAGGPAAARRGTPGGTFAFSHQAPAGGLCAAAPFGRREAAYEGQGGSWAAEGAAAALLPEDPDSSLAPIPLQGREILIGKQKSLVDMVIQDDTVSRIHARIVRKNGSYFISDMGSKNGTFVDGQAVVGREEVMLTEGARVRFSGCSYTYHAMPAPA